MTANVTVSAPSRLHFGLFSVGTQVERQFGGLGLMIAAPRTVIEIAESDQLEISGPEAAECRKGIACWFDRIKKGPNSFSKTFVEFDSIRQLPFRLDIKSVSPRHCGLGSGTQLSLASTMAISKFFDVGPFDPRELAATVGRGRRSAIGTHGFFQGGLLVDRGRSKQDRIAPLDFRTDFPEQWSILLVMNREFKGLSGESESVAFKTLPSVSPEKRNTMVRLVRDQIVPAILQKNFASFAEAIFGFGYQSGLFFASAQGGAYNGEATADLVESIREFGFRAVGQSSWGPCIFMIGRHDEEVARCSESLIKRYGDKFDLIQTRADNRGAVVRSHSVSNPLST